MYNRHVDKEIKTKDITKRNIYNDDDSGKFYLLLLVAPLILSFIVSFIVSQIAQGQEVKTETITSSTGYAIAMFILQIALDIGIFFLYNKWKNIDNRAVNLNFKLDWKIYLLLIFTGVMSLFGIQYFIGSIDKLLEIIGFPLKEGLMIIEPTNWWKYLLSIVILAFVPAVCEELLFRGVILNGLRSKFNDYISIVLAALMFALMHQNLQQFVYPFLLGCIMGWIVLRTGSLVSSILVHFINNFLVVTFSFIEYTTGFAFVVKDMWWFYILAILLLAITFAIFYLLDDIIFKHKSATTREKTSSKTSPFIYISFAVAAVLLVVSTIVAFAS